MIRILITIILTVITGCAGWNVNIAGIPLKQIQNRNWKMMIAGAASSFAVHEASHFLYAEMHGGGSWDIGNPIVVYMDHYYSRTHNEQQMFHRAGFLGQLLIGGALTAIPATRHSDFTLGFNATSTAQMLIYTATGNGIIQNKKYSDIDQLDHGAMEGSIYTIGAGVLTYINLDGE